MKFQIPLYLGASLLLTALFTPACRSTGGGRPDTQPIFATPPVSGIPELEADMDMLDARFVQEGDGRVACFALALKTGNELDVLFHVAWTDEAQRPITGLPQAWFPAHLVRGQPVSVRAPAPDPRARSFHLLFQRPGAIH